MKKNITIVAIILILLTGLIVVTAELIPGQGVTKMLFYEGMLLFYSLVIIIVLKVFFTGELFYFKWGNISAPGSGIKLLIVKKGESWLKTGIVFSILITAATSLFMMTGMKAMGLQFQISLLTSRLHWIILLSVINAWGEEIIYRFLPAQLMRKQGDLAFYPGVTAIIFGLAHFRGNPGGLVGIIMSAILGYILAKSVKDTGGLFWAIVLHLLQDLAIFTILVSYGMID